MSSSQFAEWLAYSSIEPFGEYRPELRHGQLMHLLDLAHFKRDDPRAPIDFMNFADKPEEKEIELTPEEMSKRIDREAFGL